MPSLSHRSWWSSVVGVVAGFVGLALVIPGIKLLSLGGSGYYALAGVWLLVVGVLLVRRRQEGIWLYAAFFIVTVLWALSEVGVAFWPLVPRLATFAGLGVLVFLVALSFPKEARPGWKTTAPLAAAGVLILGLLAMVVGLFQMHGVVRNPVQLTTSTSLPNIAGEKAQEWRHWGRTPAGTRYAPFDQINVGNVKNLAVAWTYRTGDVAEKGAEDQDTPLQVGDALYLCTPHGVVIALDSESGTVRWRFDTHGQSPIWQRCRGVGYYDPAVAPVIEAAGTTQGSGFCSTRIIASNISAQLWALDAKSGKPCSGFGHNGMVDLREGLGEVKPGMYIPTSAPTVIGNLVLLGAFVLDNWSVDEPSGVVRAFSAVTGQLVWAWDLGNPEITQLPPPGKTYTRSTPNMWMSPAFDPELGLIYLPMGNGTPDMFAATRTKETERHSSAIVALDIATGRERWVFQTVHHDMWDYDIPAQPALVDLPDAHGGKTPALVALTKRGQIFLLDRRTGESLAEVREKPVPQGAVAGDWTSPTQPYSVGMPAIGAEPLTEAQMWGATPFDQLWCRLYFKESRYEGDFTPYSLKGTIVWPGLLGGFNWGSASVDERHNLIFLNNMLVPVWVRLLSREQFHDYESHPEKVKRDAPYGFIVPLAGTPYGAIRNMMFSPLGVPCGSPPYGTYTVIDLTSRKIVWQTPAGTLEDAGPLEIKTHLPIPVGMPTLGGSMTTASGLTFHAGTMDNYLRAINTLTGEELWHGRLPVGSQGTPVTYISPQSGTQFVVLSVGGGRVSEVRDRGDYVIAFKLKDRQIANSQ